MDVNGVQCNVRIDTGAQANLICNADIIKLAEEGIKPFIHDTIVQLRSYSGHSIPVLGKCLIRVNKRMTLYFRYFSAF